MRRGSSSLIAIALIVIGIIAAFLFFTNNNSVNVNTNEDNIIVSTNSSVETADNMPGTSVVIPKVVLAKSGFIMIHKSNDGRTGAIVMTGDYLSAGEHTNVVVKTGITTQVGEKYFAMLHSDNGNEKYDDPGADPPVIGDNGIVQTEFEIVGKIIAEFSIITNGTGRTFTAAMYHNLSADAYIDSSNPNEVIVNKTGLTWQGFFDTLPFNLDKTCLVTGTGQEFCSGEQGVLAFTLNGVASPNVLDEIISSGDKFKVKFTSN